MDSMRNKTGILKSLGFATALGLAACRATPPSNYIEGEVVKEFGNVIRIVESSGALFGNESVKLGEGIYGIKINTPKGTYTIEFNDNCGVPGPKTNHNLAMMIKEGTRVRFPTENLLPSCGNGNQVGFTRDRIGYLDSDEIEILD